MSSEIQLSNQIVGSIKPTEVCVCHKKSANYFCFEKGCIEKSAHILCSTCHYEHNASHNTFCAQEVLSGRLLEDLHELMETANIVISNKRRKQKYYEAKIDQFCDELVDECISVIAKLRCQTKTLASHDETPSNIKKLKIDLEGSFNRYQHKQIDNKSYITQYASIFAQFKTIHRDVTNSFSRYINYDQIVTFMALQRNKLLNFWHEFKVEIDSFRKPLTNRDFERLTIPKFVCPNIPIGGVPILRRPKLSQVPETLIKERALFTLKSSTEGLQIWDANKQRCVKRIGPKASSGSTLSAMLLEGKCFLSIEPNYYLINTHSGYQEIITNLKGTFRGWVELPEKMMMAYSSFGLFLIDLRTRSASQLLKEDIKGLALLDNSTIACIHKTSVYLCYLTEDYTLKNSKILTTISSDISASLVTIHDNLFLLNMGYRLELWDWKQKRLVTSFVDNNVESIMVLNYQKFTTTYAKEKVVKLWDLNNPTYTGSFQLTSGQKLEVRSDGKLFIRNP